MYRFSALALVAAVAGGPACRHTPSAPKVPPIDYASHQTRVPGEYLITLTPGANVKIISELYGLLGIKKIKDLGHNLFQVTLTEDPGPEKIEELRGKNAQIKATQPNAIYRIHETGGPR
ncbi:hypothetical protein WDW86_05960 [Bdellovibrionota bacterium FG-2]